MAFSSSTDSHLAPVTRTVMPILSTRSQSTLGVGTSGEPSYKTMAAPVARMDTIQFHIIQPAVV